MDHHGHAVHNASTMPFLEFVQFSTPDNAVSYAMLEKEKTVMLIHVLSTIVATLFLLPAGKSFLLHVTSTPAPCDATCFLA